MISISIAIIISITLILISISIRMNLIAAFTEISINTSQLLVIRLKLDYFLFLLNIFSTIFDRMRAFLKVDLNKLNSILFSRSL
jgi:hypothetical protein